MFLNSGLTSVARTTFVAVLGLSTFGSTIAYGYTNLWVDIPTANSVISGSPFVVTGWAVDTRASSGPGIGAINVWAYPTNGGSPIFAGAGATGGYRPDIGAWLGAQFNYAGYGLTASLPAGSYTLVVYGLSTYDWNWDAVQSLGITVNCAVASSLSPNCAVQVMSVPYPAYAYNMNVTYIPELGANPYLAMFDAEIYQSTPVRNVGDSAGVRFGSTAFDFGTHSYQSDLGITRPQGSTDNDPPNYTWMGPWPEGASNPQLIQVNGNWTAYWLSTEPDNGNNHLMFAYNAYGNIGQFFNSWWITLSTSYSWLWSWTMVYPNLGNAIDVSRDEGGFMVSDNQSLLGTMTTGPDGTAYFYYVDHVQGGFYRRVINPWLWSFGAPQLVSSTGAASVYYHKDLNQWVAFYYCIHDGRYDMCARRFYDSMLTQAADGGGTISQISSADYVNYGIRWDLDANIPWWSPSGELDPGHQFAGSNYQLNQPGFRKNALGQLFTDQDGDTVIYVTVKQPPQFGGDNVTGNMYGKSVWLTPR